MEHEGDVKTSHLTRLLECGQFIFVEANVVRSVFCPYEIES